MLQLPIEPQGNLSSSGFNLLINLSSEFLVGLPFNLEKVKGIQSWSDGIPGFDCGGQQWVSETCFLVRLKMLKI